MRRARPESAQERVAGLVGAALRRGSSTRNVVPTPGVESTSTRPPQVCTRCQTVARPRPGAAADLLGGEERLEDPLEHFARHAHAGVGDDEALAVDGAAAVARRERLDTHGDPGFGRRVALQLVVQRIARIHEQVQHDLMQVGRVLERGPATSARRPRRARCAGRRWAAPGRRWRRRSPTECTCAGSCSPFRPKVSRRLVSVAARSAAPAMTSSSRCRVRVGVALFAQQLHFQHDRRQQVVELVRDAADHLADGAQPAALRQLGVHRPQRRAPAAATRVLRRRWCQRHPDGADGDDEEDARRVVRHLLRGERRRLVAREPAAVDPLVVAGAVENRQPFVDLHEPIDVVRGKAQADREVVDGRSGRQHVAVAAARDDGHARQPRGERRVVACPAASSSQAGVGGVDGHERDRQPESLEETLADAAAADDHGFGRPGRPATRCAPRSRRTKARPST